MGYTFYHKSIVKQPKNIILAEDIFAHSYVSGEGTGVFPGENGSEDGKFSQQLASDHFTHDIIPIWLAADPTTKKVKNPPILWILLVSTTTRLLMQTILLSPTRLNTMLMPALMQVHLDSIVFRTTTGTNASCHQCVTSTRCASRATS